MRWLKRQFDDPLVRIVAGVLLGAAGLVAASWAKDQLARVIGNHSELLGVFAGIAVYCLYALLVIGMALVLRACGP